MIIIETWQHPTDCGLVIRDTKTGDFSSLDIESDEWLEVDAMGENYNLEKLEEIAAKKLGQDYDGEKWSDYNHPIYVTYVGSWGSQQFPALFPTTS